MSKKSALDELGTRAGELREALGAHKQQELFAAAVEAAYLTAIADGTFDDEERRALVKAVEILSSSLVIEWETEEIIEDCKKKAEAEGSEARAKATGERLKELDQIEGGILVAAIVACASGGIEKSESEVLKAVGKAAGLDNKKTGAITKRAATFFSS